jgi:hypothetical protein
MMEKKNSETDGQRQSIVDDPASQIKRCTDHHHHHFQ